MRKGFSAMAGFRLALSARIMFQMPSFSKKFPARAGIDG
jgi:hypothetical protein